MSEGRLPQRVFVLAGGLGTRLQKVLPDRPKVLAPVGQYTFLDYLLAKLCSWGLRRFVFLLGHRHQQVEDHLRRVVLPRRPELEIETSVESQPLGTGGALKLAGRFCDGTFLLVNGDSYLNFDARAFFAIHVRRGALVTLAAKKVGDVSRFGSLRADASGWLVAFREKSPGGGPGLVSAGVYAMEPGVLEAIATERAVSLETEVLPALLRAGQPILCLEQHGEFFDIGTEESYRDFLRFAKGQDPFAAE